MTSQVPRSSGPAGLRALLYVPLVAYPVLVLFGLPYLGVRGAALALLGVVGLSIALQLWGRGRVNRLTWIPLFTVGLLSISAMLNEMGWMLAVPSAISLLLFGAFAPTLVFGPPMVERFARLQHPDLKPEEARWCRGWTLGWCGFFLVNASIAGALAAFAPLFWWTLYTSVLAYLLMALLFASEWVLRKLFFRRFSPGRLEQWLSRFGSAS